MNPELLNRREAIARLAMLIGFAVIGAESLLSGASVAGKKTAPGFSDAERTLLDEIGDTIIPATDTPGAKAAHIGAFMIMMVTDCYDDAHHAVFKAGLGKINEASRQRHGKSFLASTPAERTALLNELDAEQRAHQAQKAKDEPPHYFRLLKQLTLLGYFTSEIGCTKALRYLEVPGAYRGSEPYKKGDRAWFTAPSRGFTS